MPCDICGDQKATKRATAQAMSRAVQLGFNPFATGLIPAKLAKLSTPESPAEWKQHAIDGLLAQVEWKLCDICMARFNTSPLK